MKRLAPSLMVGAAALSGALTFGSAALAEETVGVEIRRDHVPTTAQAFDDHDCGDFGVNNEIKDLWVFQHNKVTEKLVEVVARFRTPAGYVVIHIPLDGGALLLADQRASLETEPGWQLVAARAVITATGRDDGVVPDFFLDCAVPAIVMPSSTSEPTQDPTSPPEPTSTAPSTPDSTVTPSQPTPTQEPELPLTGPAMLPAILAGVGAVLGGATLLVTARRKRLRAER